MAKGKTRAASVAKSHAETISRTTKRQEHPSVSDAASRMTKRHRPEYNLLYSPSKRTRHLAQHLSKESKPLDDIPNKSSHPTCLTVEVKGLGHSVRDNGGGDDEIQRSDSLDLLCEGNKTRAATVSPVVPCREPYNESARVDHDKSLSIDKDGPISVHKTLNNQQTCRVHGQTPKIAHSVRSEAEKELASDANDTRRAETRRYGKGQFTPVEMDPKYWLRRQIYPVLEILSHQILWSLVNLPVDHRTVTFDMSSSMPSRDAWVAIQSLFNQAKSLLRHTRGFLDEPNVAEGEESNEQLIWQVNITSALCLLLTSERGYDDMQELHTRFLELFCNRDHELLEWQVALLLDIKKEIWTIGAEENRFSRADGLRNIFLSDHGNGMTKQVQVQCSKILPALQETTVEVLPQQFSFKQYYGQRFQQLARNILDSATPRSRQDGYSNNGFSGIAPTQSILENWGICKRAGPLLDSDYEADETEQNKGYDDDCDGGNQSPKASNHITLSDNDRAYPVPSDRSATIQDRVKTLNLSEISAGTENRRLAPGAGRRSPLKQYGIEHSTPSSTQEQYEKAKLAASVKAAARNKGIPLQPSQRRPWSPEEENALMTGLDRVQGPHWSQILAMYGAGGSISDILKDRNQVQLKDKARNLKLFFLKSGHDVPHYLKNVTGELKTRAPTQTRKTDVNDFQAASSSQNSPGAEALETAKLGTDETAPAPMLEPYSPALTSEYRGQAPDLELRTDNQHGHRKEDEEDLSNAIQLALQAIQEKNSGHVPEEERDGRADRTQGDQGVDVAIAART